MVIATVGDTYAMILLVYLLVSLSVCRGASLSKDDESQFQNLIEGQGLYSPQDDVVVLTVKNFDRLVYGQKHAWFIEFYNSWCGFCQKFAPSWKALGSDIRSWKDLVSVGAIDCSNEDNSAICRKFDIMGYPTLRYFHEDYKDGPDNMGVTVEKGVDVHSHREGLIKRILEEQREGRGKMYPDLSPYTQDSLSHVFEKVSLNTKYVFFIFESGTYFGPEIALDLNNVKNIAVRYANESNKRLISDLKVTTFPHMLVISDDNTKEQFSDGLKTREALLMAIKEYLKGKKVALPEDTKPAYTFEGKWMNAQVPDISLLLQANKQRKDLKEKVKKMGDVVFQVDLETALRYSLKHEVGNTKTISGEKRDALLNYLTVLSKHFPFPAHGKKFLNELNYLVETTDSLDGTQIKDAVTNAENNLQVFSSAPHWLGCQGSQPQFRGYTCGLWTMFHHLTVSAAESADARFPLEVLHAMHGYIKHFFGCADCSRHFQDMAKEKRINDSQTLDQAVLWLWRAHNTVNKRLHGDITEDPEHPKIAFPSEDRCPLCRSADDVFDEQQVLRYLKTMYGSANIRYLGTDSRVSTLGGPNPNATLFQKLDASMCFVIYVLAFLLLMVLIRMFSKRGYRKKMYAHDLLGKV